MLAGDRSIKKFRTMKRSFVDSDASSPLLEEYAKEEGPGDDWFMEDPPIEPDNDTTTEKLRDGVLVVSFLKAMHLELCRNWKKSLIIKFLGKQVGFETFRFCLVRL